jgi:hypothetical protein
VVVPWRGLSGDVVAQWGCCSSVMAQRDCCGSVWMLWLSGDVVDQLDIVLIVLQGFVLVRYFCE